MSCDLRKENYLDTQQLLLIPQLQEDSDDIFV
jgi:hypothetical protein